MRELRIDVHWVAVASGFLGKGVKGGMTAMGNYLAATEGGGLCIFPPFSRPYPPMVRARVHN